jgi:hypothetical protein
MVTIHVYIDNGNVYSYQVDDETSAREHASAIISTGYRSVGKSSPMTMTWYPVHRISKVKLELDKASKTSYTDVSRGT